jgi:hypothetical protein
MAVGAASSNEHDEAILASLPPPRRLILALARRMLVRQRCRWRWRWLRNTRDVKLCTYNATHGHQVLIRYALDSNDTTFQEGKAGFTNNGFATATVTGIGDEAYSSTIGTPSGPIYTNTLVVLKGSVEVEISAPGDLAPIEALANEVLAKL